MSKTLWKTVKIDVPREMVDITKNGKVTIKNTLTNTNNISKSNKEPSIILKAKDIDKPIIENSGKTYDVKDLKERVKKAKDMAKKNENKEFIKKSKINPIIKKINNDKEHVDNINRRTKIDFKNFNTLVKELIVFEGNNFQDYLKENKDKYKKLFLDKYDYTKEHLKLNEVEISEYTGYKSNFVNNNSGFLIKSGSNETMTTHQTIYYHVYMVKDLSKGYYDRKNWKEYYIKFVVPLKKEREKKKRSLLF
jgi:hypothetical protein